MRRKPLVLFVVLVSSIFSLKQLALTSSDVRISSADVNEQREAQSILHGNHSFINSKPANQTSNTPRKSPRLLCWILCDPVDLDKRVTRVRDTWAKRCDVTLYMSSEYNSSFPTIGLAVEPGRSHIASKAKAAWTYVHKHHLMDADYFVKADPDTYIVVDNLRKYMENYDPETPELFGHRFKLMSRGGLVYTSGGPGEVLSRAGVRTLVEDAFSKQRSSKDCMPDGQAEDLKLAVCLKQVGVDVVDTRDVQGRETFIVFNLESQISGRFPQWYIDRDPDGSLWGMGSISQYPISFHYVGPSMYVLDYLFYYAKRDSQEAAVLKFGNYHKQSRDVFNKTRADDFESV